MKTSTQIIEEAVENYDNYLSNNVPSMDRFQIHEALNQLRSILSQAMKTAVEERNMEIAFEISDHTPGFMVQAGKITEEEIETYERIRMFFIGLVRHGREEA